MILDEGGKYRSVRTYEENKQLLLDEIKNLSPEERAAFRVVMNEMLLDTSKQSGTPLVEMIGNAEYKHKPVDIETFIKDPHFLGDTCLNTYPTLLEDLKNIFTGDYNEVIFTGGIGYGKSHAASIGVCRIIYELSCMKSPQTSLGLANLSNIAVVVLSATETLAIKVAFEYIATKIRNSPYFQNNFPFKLTKREMRFDNNVVVHARATTDNAALGMNAIAAWLDEANFYQKPTRSVKNLPSGPQYDQAETIYNSIKLRMKSRFEARGRLPCILFLTSSKQTFDDFTARRVRVSKNDPKIYIADYALWEVKKDNFDLSNCFHVLCGNETSISKILRDDEIEEAKATLAEGAKIIEVPMDFKGDFERDLENALRDIAGMATAAISPYITRREKITEAEQLGGVRSHPFTTEVYDMSRGGSFSWRHLVRSVEERDPGGLIRKVMKPIVSPNQVRHIHIDPSLRGDCTGFCVAHVCGWKDVIRRNDGGQEYAERAPVFYVDCVLRIVPPIGSEIILGNVRQLVYDLSAHGYIITRVTSDAYQSADNLQMLAQRGYTSELVSVDLTMDAYENLKLAIYENRVILYGYEPLRQELRSLEVNHKKHKVDHPPRGKKDVADALAGCLFTLSQAHVNMPLPILPTSAFNSAAWVDTNHAAMQGGSSALGSAGSLGGAQLPPFITSTFGSDWGNGWDPGSL